MLRAPALGAVLVYLSGKADETARVLAAGISFGPLVRSIVLLLGFFPATGVELRSFREPGGAFTYRAYESAPWFPSASISYSLGVDELSVPLVFLTCLLTTLALVINWDERRRGREFYAMFPPLETTILGVFMSLDFFLFFLFWEGGPVPMDFILPVLGGARRSDATPQILPFP